MLRKLFRFIFYKIWLCSDKRIIDYHFMNILGRKMNWDNPRDLNEKINWLKIYGDTSLWSKLADKYEVRKFIINKKLEDILIPIYGRWSSVDQIDWNSLPQSFVLKTNHGCGGVYIVKDKTKLNVNQISRELSHSLKERYGFYQGEPHYLKIPPLIIAEQLLEDNGNFSFSMVDYKVWCFNGSPYCVFVCYNRTKSSLVVECYDLEWNFHPEWISNTSHVVGGKGIVPKPINLDYMINCAKLLSEGFPQVRIDFYNIDGKVYFGEMTFTSLGGFMRYFTDKVLNEMGEKIEILK